MNPHVDFHALAPELVLTATILVVLIADLIWPDRSRFASSRIASVGVLASLIPVITLAADGTDRVMFGGAFVVDAYSLAFTGFFLNLFNLVPVWQLDGARGFHALSTQERWVAVGAVAIALWATGLGLLWIVGGVAAYRAVRDTGGPGHTPTLVTFCSLVFALAWFASDVN